MCFNSSHREAWEKSFTQIRRKLNRMLITHDTVSNLVPNRDFAELATDEQIQHTAQALEANNIHTLIAENAEEAKRLFFELLPEGSEIFLGASVTLEMLGIKDEIDKSRRYDALR